MPKHIEIELSPDGVTYKLFLDHQFIDLFLDPLSAMEEANRLIRYNLECEAWERSGVSHSK